VEAKELEIVRDGERVPATLVLPRRRQGRLPAWVALGGVSRMGRFHPQLVRFANALATTGAAVLVPEVPEWRRLRVTPRVTAPTIRGCLDALRDRSEARPGKIGLVGFSFGAPQVAIAASREDLAEHVAGIVLFGGYCSLESTVTCQLTGHHEWMGERHQLSPDPYGRWVVASNHLTDVPGYEDATDVAMALHHLAAAASDQRISAWMPHHDAMIEGLRSSLPKCRRPLFDCFATPTHAPRPAVEGCDDLARRLAAACRRVEPLLEPQHALADVAVPTRLIHGRGDRLIPFTEGYRMMARLPHGMGHDLTVTSLFAHSADESCGSLPTLVRENVALFGAIRGLINTV
jgi:pimeloyl-ACP methyl ester carboxylesterase